MVHGAGFTILGCDNNLNYFEDNINNHFEVNVRGRLGSGSHDDKAIRALNRIIRWTNTGLKVEADPWHVEILIKEMGLGEANPVQIPGAKEREGRSEQAEQLLDKSAATRCRACVARANYLAPERSDIAYAVKEACRDMANPSSSSWEKVKRVLRYLKGLTCADGLLREVHPYPIKEFPRNTYIKKKT